MWQHGDAALLRQNKRIYFSEFFFFLEIAYWKHKLKNEENVSECCRKWNFFKNPLQQKTRQYFWTVKFLLKVKVKKKINK